MYDISEASISTLFLSIYFMRHHFGVGPEVGFGVGPEVGFGVGPEVGFGVGFGVGELGTKSQFIGAGVGIKDAILLLPSFIFDVDNDTSGENECESVGALFEEKADAGCPHAFNCKGYPINKGDAPTNIFFSALRLFNPLS